MNLGKAIKKVVLWILVLILLAVILRWSRDRLGLWYIDHNASYNERTIQSAQHWNKGHKVLYITSRPIVEMTMYQSLDTKRIFAEETYQYRLHGKLGGEESPLRDSTGRPWINPSSGMPTRMTGWITASREKEPIRSEDILAIEFQVHHSVNDGVTTVLFRKSYKDGLYEAPEPNPYRL